MFDFNNRCGVRLQKLLVLHIAVVLFAVACCCYNPCPESLRGTAADTPCAIPDSEVEKAFQQGNVVSQNKIKQEKDLVSKGKVVNRRIKSADSVHQQAMGSPRNRRMGLRQMRFQEASKILIEKYNLTKEQVSCGLPKLRLSQPSAASAVRGCVSNDTLTCDSSPIYRTLDGTCNNLNNPTWGSAFSCFNRILPPVYSSGNDDLRLSVIGGAPLPAPRSLSVNVHSNFSVTTTVIDHMFMFFGQMLDHDMTLTAASVTENNEAILCCPNSPTNHPQCAPVLIPTNDYFYGPRNVSCLNFVRSGICPFCTLGPRVQVNEKTAYIDASFVYGNSVNESNSLRTNDGTGRLRVQNIAGVGQLLPPSTDPANDNCSIPAANQICFLAGDERANQHPPLTSLHTMFLREHNRIATMLGTINPQWDDETRFQQARKIVGAEMQMITYNEFLPVALGYEDMSSYNLWISNRGYTSYDPSVDATLMTEFSTAGFRFGHTLANSWIAEFPSRNSHSGHLLRNKFFDPFSLYTGEMDPVLRGSTRSPAQFFDQYMIPDLTNYLYRIGNDSSGSDLASFNIQRGRDHGLQSYTAYVNFCSQITIQTFDDLCKANLMSRDNMYLLQSMYRSVDDIDLFTGMLLEYYYNDAVIGPTAICIVGSQFRKLKYGDRFYFEHGGQSGSFTPAQRDQIKRVTLARIMCDNTDITQIQGRAMLQERNNNPVVWCNQLSAMNLQAWKQ